MRPDADLDENSKAAAERIERFGFTAMIIGTGDARFPDATASPIPTRSPTASA